MESVKVRYCNRWKIYQNAIHCNRFNHSNWTAVQPSASLDRFRSCLKIVWSFSHFIGVDSGQWIKENTTGLKPRWSRSRLRWIQYPVSTTISTKKCTMWTKLCEWVRICFTFYILPQLMRGRQMPQNISLHLRRGWKYLWLWSMTMICTCSKNNLLFYGMVPDSLPELPNSLGPRVLLSIHLSKQHLLYHSRCQCKCHSNIFKFCRSKTFSDTALVSLASFLWRRWFALLFTLFLIFSSWRGWPPGPRLEVVVQFLSLSTTLRWNIGRSSFLTFFIHSTMALSSRHWIWREGPRRCAEQGQAAQEVKYLRLWRSLKVFQLCIKKQQQITVVPSSIICPGNILTT